MLLFSFVGFSQTNTIKGILIDQNKQPFAFANIVLQSSNTNFKIGTTSNENGVFEFNAITKGKYTLSVFYLGYQDVSQELTITENLNLKPITLTEDATSLEQVEITVKKPTIVQKADKLIFNIQNTILANQDSWRILNSTPSVFVNNEELLVKNNIASVYVNDKKIKLPNSELKSFLESLGGDTIKSIEIIANPSAKYDAQGAAIINIVLKKSLNNSYKGNVSTNYISGVFDRYKIGTSHFYKKDNIDITANYSFNNTEKILFSTEEINFFDNSNILTSNWFTNTDIITKNQKHNLLFNIDYTLNKTDVLSLSTLHNILVNEEENNKTNGTIFNSVNSIDSTYIANNNATKDKKYFSYGVDFSHKFNDKGEKIVAAINYSYYNNDRKQRVNTDYFLPDNSFIRNNNFLIKTAQKTKIYATKFDYSLPLENAALFESGIKVSKIKSNSDFKQFNQDLVLDNTKSNLFLYSETNYATYAKYEIELAKYYYQIGFRGEYTDLQGNSNREINSEDYFKLFPSLLFNYYPNDNHDFTISYRKSINRPKYHQLNPFQFFFSDFAANVGNPELKPTVQHNIDFTYVYKKAYIFNLFYSNQKDRASEIAFQDNETNLVKYINVNLDKYTSFGMLFNTTYAITKRWSLFSQLFLVNRTNSFVALETENEIISKSNFNYNIKFVNNFTLLKDKSLKASVSYQYVSPDISGPTEQSRYLKTDFSLQKSFFNNKAILSFGIDDVFETANGTFITKYKNQDIRYFQNADTNLFNIGFRYNFGNNKLRENNRKKTIKEEDRLKN